ncbi:ZIP-like iron-zinc transporter [Mycena pura]|uniref:ZIP-like iron-zinc transporter n=1 Tax=Mycena pura TaxID=153505 RepID=A0AAD6YCD3_9AGAR|nr:ZIP-like iron-zinc transporter [Mycena pura]
MSDTDCSIADNADTFFGLRVASVFIILACSTVGALFPVLAKQSTWLPVPTAVFDFAKYFGSGVIIATAFIHLLAPALDELSSDCLSPAWKEYPYALALCLLSIMSIFVTELVAFRWGTARLRKIGVQHDAHGHHVGSHAAHGPENAPDSPPAKAQDDAESASINMDRNPSEAATAAAAHIIGIAILEFGVLLHSVLIGLTLAVDEAFKPLFVVLVFHQTFEGLGLGSRLAALDLPARRGYRAVPVLAAVLYGLSTPVGIAAGLGIRTTYNPGGARASLVSGVLDALSAGVLIYTGLVELLAHEFLFSKDMAERSRGHLAYAVVSMLLGCGIMALLGRWA